MYLKTIHLLTPILDIPIHLYFRKKTLEYLRKVSILFQYNLGHNNQLLVSAGDRVYQGQVVAKAGATGYVTGAHVHFEVRVNGEKVNPLNYVSIG